MERILNMNIRKQFIAGAIFALVFATYAHAVEIENSNQIKTAVREALQKKTIQSGTLDIYDKDSDRVRNLRKIKMHEDVVGEEGKYLVLGDYRDISTGDIVVVEIEVVQEETDFIIEDIRIKDVQKLNEREPQEDKEYTDEEIQAFMQEFVKKQTQFTDGIVMLFDKDNEKMRHLKLTELKKEVRRMGVFYSSSSQFVDADTGDIVSVDIAVEKKKGKLKIQALRIRDVRKGPGPKKAE